MFVIIFIFFFNDPATTEIYTLSLHDALPIFPVMDDPTEDVGVGSCRNRLEEVARPNVAAVIDSRFGRSEEHTSELQSQSNLVCRLLLEKKKKTINTTTC